MSSETLLAIDGIVLPPGAARGLRQTLEPIDNGPLRRTVNGALVDLTRAPTRKLRSTLTCDDQAAPGLAQLWRGALVTLDCVATLSQSVAPPAVSVALERLPVAVSVQAWATDGSGVAITGLTGQTASFATAVALVRYRPRLTMRVISRSEETDEAGVGVLWTVTLEEA